MLNLKPASVGSVSTATLRPEDLLSAFLSEVERLSLLSGDFLAMPENFPTRDYFAGVVGDAQDYFAEDGEIPEGADVSEVLEELQEVLSRFAPPYCYFGTHPGDGADFGFWPSFEEIDELPTVEDSDGARELGEDCKAVNDHGNVTVYGADGSILLEIV